MRNLPLSIKYFRFPEPLRILFIISQEKFEKGREMKKKARKKKNEKVKHKLVLCLDDENKN